MGFFDGILKGVGKVASIAAPFLPGPWGAVAGLVGGMAEGAGSQKKADQAQGQMGDALRNYQMQVAQLTSDPSQYYQNQLGMVGQNNAALYNQALESSDPAYDDMVNQLRQQAMDNGIGGSALAAQLAHLAMNRGQATSGIMRDIGINNMNQRMDIYKQLANAQMQNRQLGLGAQGNVLNATMGHLGGLQGMYANQAAQSGKSVTDLLGTLGQGGVYDLFKKKRTGQAGGSGSLGSTAAQSPSATPTTIGGGINARYGNPTNNTGVRYGAPQQGLFQYK